MNDYELLVKIFKPYKIVKKGKVFIFYTMEGDYVCKDVDINYDKLYQYLFSRGFSNVPKLSKDSRSSYVVMEYEKDIVIDKNQKMNDLCNLVSLLHNKTSYYKEITKDKYQSIYDSLKDYINSIKSLYDYYFDNIIVKEYYSPSEYLFLNNYSIFYYSIYMSLEYLDKWYMVVKDKRKERVCLIHNNLKLDHFIKNENSYLISWDKYKIDVPVLDMVHLFWNSYLDGDFVSSFYTYLKNYPWQKEEKLLFLVLINVPFAMDFNDNERKIIDRIKKLIIYLKKVDELNTKMATEV